MRKLARSIDQRRLAKYVDLYPQIGLKTLLIWGKQDRVVPLSRGRDLHGMLVNSTLVEIDRCGHIPQEEHASVVIEAVRNFAWGSGR
jgi:pimeloyl-ACP methyl ester carboxylesterase